jgi:hypothetical protein
LFPPAVKTAPEAVKKPSGVPPENVEVRKMRERIASSGLTTEKVLDFLVNLGVIEGTVSSIEELQKTAPEAFEMLSAQAEDIFSRIKGE